MPLVDQAWYCNFGNGTSTGHFAVTAWVLNTSKTCGALIRATAPAALSERVFVCIASTSGTGTTGGTQPTWILTRGAKTTDNTVTWMECSGIAALNGDVTNSPTWNNVKNTAVLLGQVITNVARTLIMICTTAGTTGNGAEPSWAAKTNAGATTADNTATWTTLGASFSAWGAPAARLYNVLTAQWAQAGAKVFVASNHAETYTVANYTLESVLSTQTAPIYIVSIDQTLTLPPAAASIKVGASLTTTSTFRLYIQGTCQIHESMTYCCTSDEIQVNTNSYYPAEGLFKNCLFKKLGTSAGVPWSLNFNNGKYTLDNCQWFAGHIGDSVFTSAGNVVWRNSTVIGGSTIPTTLFVSNTSSVGPSTTFEGCDLTNLAGGTLANTQLDVSFVGCKLASNYVLGTTNNSSCRINVVGCDSAATNYQTAMTTAGITQTPSTTVVRTGGASQGVTTFSWNLVTTTSITWQNYAELNPLYVWNSVLSTNRVVTVYGVINQATLPNNDDIWIDVHYLGSAATPIWSNANSTKATIFTANAALTADTSAWDTGATARANTTGYLLGQVIKVASNTGRIFVCTQAGTSAGSEPVGYASAVDGGSVTDSGAIFRAAMRFRMSVTLSAPQPALAGYMRVLIKVGDVSTTYWVDPQPVLS